MEKLNSYKIESYKPKHNCSFGQHNFPKRSFKLLSAIAKYNDFESIHNLNIISFKNYIKQCESAEEFIKLTNRENLETYVIKNTNNQFMGYIQNKKSLSGDVYVACVAIEPKYKHTKAVYAVFNELKNLFFDLYRKKQVQTLSLHVDTENRELLNLYNNLGFKISKKIDNFWGVKSAYHMTLNLSEYFA